MQNPIANADGKVLIKAEDTDVGAAAISKPSAMTDAPAGAKAGACFSNTGAHTSRKKSTMANADTAETRAEADIQGGAETSSRTGTKVGAETRSEPQDKADCKTGAKADGKAGATTLAKASAKTGAKADAKVAVKSSGKPDGKVDPKPQDKTDSTTGAKADAKARATTTAKASAKTIAKADAEGAAKTSGKPGVKADAKTRAEGESGSKTVERTSRVASGTKTGPFSKAEDKAMLEVLRDFAQDHGLPTDSFAWLKSSRAPGADNDDLKSAEDLWGLKAQVLSRTRCSCHLW